MWKKKRSISAWSFLLPILLLVSLGGYLLHRYQEHLPFSLPTNAAQGVEQGSASQKAKSVEAARGGKLEGEQGKPPRAKAVEATEEPPEAERIDAAFVFMRPHQIARLPRAKIFDPAMGTEDGAFVYNAQSFLSSEHLGDDLNGIGGWNTDLGDPVYAVAEGRVTYRGIPSAPWGKMVILSHMVDGKIYQSVYAHLKEIEVQSGEFVHRGQQIATVGNARGRYYAHLHLEIRQSEVLDPSFGYAESSLGRLSPETWVAERRQLKSAAEDEQGKAVSSTLPKLPVVGSVLSETRPEVFFELD